MKKVININFHGSIVPIEETAYDILREYIDSLRNYFAAEDGKDEIINDIETRISELFQAQLKNGATCITDDHVNVIIANMGRPKDFAEADSDGFFAGEDESKASASSSSYHQQGYTKRLARDENNKILGGVCSGIAVYLGVDPWLVRILFILSGIGLVAYIILWIFLPNSQTTGPTGPKKKFFRNPDDKIIAGVCGGIGSYFNINPWIPRILFLLPMFTFLGRWSSLGFWSFPGIFRISFSPTTIIVYIILWLLIPEAKSTSEKLQMKGEKVDLDSIKESVTREMKGVAERMEKLGKDAGDYVKEKGPQFRSDFNQSVENSGGTLGRLIVALFKIFFYIIMGSIAFALLAAVYGIAIAAGGLFPLKSFIVTDGIQNILAWLTLIFFIIVPAVGLTVSIIRWLSRRKGNSYVRYTFIGLWVFGWICFFALISFVGRDFKYISSADENYIQMTEPAAQALEVKPIIRPDYRWKPWLNIEPYSLFNVQEDTAFVPNFSLRIVKSDDSLFAVTYLAMANGRTKEQADNRATKIEYSGYQKDNVFYIDNAIPINTTDKFRNQFVEVTLHVPVGKRIKVSDNLFVWDRSDFYIYRRSSRYYPYRISPNSGYRFRTGVEYIMTEDGLKKAGDDSVTEEKYRYRGTGQDELEILDSVKKEELIRLQKQFDSTREAQKRIIKDFEESIKKQEEEIKKIQKNQSSAFTNIQEMYSLSAFFSYI